MRLLPLAIALLAASPALATHLPFVGCPSDGQAGLQDIPRPIATPDLPPSVASKLAYYVGPDVRVLAPRGWHCFETYGSNGVGIYVTPDNHPTMPERSIVGPAVALIRDEGDTSGRFDVAWVAARMFPAAKPFVDKVEAEGLQEKPFARGPFPADKITHRGPYEALVTTPANSEGIGVIGQYRPGSLPIDGIAILHPYDAMSLTHLAARLPTAQRPLVAYIIAQVKKER